MKDRITLPVLKDNSSIYSRSKANGLLSSEVLFDTVTSPDFHQIMEQTKRSLDTVGTPDPLLARVLTEKGFNALPAQVSNTQYQMLITSGLSPIYRGVRKDDAIIDFASNPDMFVGKGLYCNGIYFMYGNPCPDGRHGDTSAKARASRYIQIPQSVPNPKLQEHLKTYTNGQVIGAIVNPNARIITIKDLIQLTSSIKQDVRLDKTISQEIKTKLLDLISQDIAVVAAMEGYDIIDITTTKYYVVLNRGMLIMNNDEVMKSR